MWEGDRVADVESEVVASGATGATGPGGETPSPRARRLPRHLPGVALLSALVAVLNGALGLQFYYRVQLGGYDLVIFDQAIRAYSHLHMPVSTFKNLTDTAEIAPGYGHQFSLLGDHFSPILATLAPLYWIWNSPAVLLVAQALLFGAAVPFVWAFTRRALTPLGARPWVPYAVGFAFGVSWMLQQATAAGFHEVAFIVPAMAAMIERGQAAALGRGRWWHVTVAAVLLALCKEEMGLVVAAYGLVLLLAYRKRRMGAAFVVAGVAATAFAIEVWLPAFGQAKGFYWYYTPLGGNFGQALRTLVLHPLHSLDIAITPAMKWQVMLALLWPLLLLPLYSPLLLLAVPLLAERMWSYKPEHWHFTQQYNSMLAPIVFLGAVDGAARLFPRWTRWRARRRAEQGDAVSTGRPVRLWAGAVALLAAVLVPFWPAMGDMRGAPFEQLFKPSQWYRAAGEQAGVEGINLIPKGSVVAADDNISTYMSAGYDVRLLTPTDFSTPWIITETYRILYPFDSQQQLYGYVLRAMSDGYQVVYSHGGYVVLHKG